MKRAVKIYAWMLLLAAWSALALLIGNDLYLPGPIKTLAALFGILSKGESYVFLAMSTGRVALGLGLALITGVPLGLGTGFFPYFRELLSPWMSVLKSVPVVSFIMLALLWLHSSVLPIFVSFLIAMPLFWTATQESVLAEDGKLLEMMKIFGVSPMKKLVAYDWPWARRYIKMALKQATGLAWRAGVAAEVLSFSPLSMGRKMIESKTYLETADLFAWTFLLVVLSFAMERVVCRETKAREF